MALSKRFDIEIGGDNYPHIEVRYFVHRITSECPPVHAAIKLVFSPNEAWLIDGTAGQFRPEFSRKIFFGKYTEALGLLQLIEAEDAIEHCIKVNPSVDKEKARRVSIAIREDPFHEYRSYGDPPRGVPELALLFADRKEAREGIINKPFMPDRSDLYIQITSDFLQSCL